ncbi:NAD-binding rossmann-fold containing protein [Stagonosporopsis vannaccii]|nr:NAD-binding rossmann-fold containing protein [Stagonosporopsis vannaccii]
MRRSSFQDEVEGRHEYSSVMTNTVLGKKTKTARRAIYKGHGQLRITGVSGHVGFRVLVEALSRNYRVRAIVRRPEQGEQIRKAGSVKALAADLEIVVVRDLLQDGAFDDVLDGVSGIVHVASPLAITTDDYKRDLIDPAVNATVNVLKSAAKVQSVRRVVITSSIATLLTMEYVLSEDCATVFTANDVYPPPDIKSEFVAPIEAYAVAKSHALAASESFVKTKKPQFDVISILPSMVIGKNELNSKREEIVTGTNGVVIGPLIGVKLEMPSLGVSVHLHDVARAHIDALNPSIPGNRRLLCSSGGTQGTTWDDAKEITRRLYSKQVSEGLFPLTGTSPSRAIHLDASETEQLLGWKFTGFEEQVKSVVDHYIDLSPN